MEDVDGSSLPADSQPNLVNLSQLVCGSAAIWRLVCNHQKFAMLV